MRDLGEASQGGSGTTTFPSCAELEVVLARLAGGVDGIADDATRIDLIGVLESIVCAAQGAQAALTADFDTSQRALAAARGVPVERRGRGIAHQVALARRESPHRGQQHLELATTARRELPHAYAAFRAGRIREWKLSRLACETGCLALADRLTIDEQLAGDPTVIEAMSDGELADAARAMACRLDPASVAAKRRKAEAERHTTLRPAPDVMTWFTALLPVKDGVAVHKALSDEADRLRNAGDPRSRGAIMADTLIRRVLAPHVAGIGPGTATAAVPLMIHVVVPDTVLLGDDDGTGWVEGYGDVPGDLLREWIAAHAEAGVVDWVKRLYETPRTGALVAMDSHARCFEGGLSEYLRLRDRRCRTPWCDAPVRHLDHPKPVVEGGPTSAVNAQGTCEGCNHAKQAHGWTARPRPGPRHTVETTTPTGHTYTSVAPPLRPRADRRVEPE